ncbi:FAD/NAD(P)-binding domain-containing protein [Suillus paluster]|uniref:FAD/NAD(P)-binding domain-containing protein n=1 Tax=Suillus paluster TaxID=48578 RepID=UPI001B863D02|nr:FAD/NAD(P)-binding domain-containing protein [Suillus paluster]KAG1741887.1 FAD/NAD(P)-binding domain-containing protein [Suillus paluster]
MSDSHRRVAIVGAGVGGLTQAIALKTKLGFHNFTVYEKGSEVGGVWRGCSSDVQIHWYSLSSDLYPHWNKSHGLQPEIQAYWIKLSKKYDLYPHIAFNTKVLSAEWDSAKQQYTLVAEDVFSGKRTDQCGPRRDICHPWSSEVSGGFLSLRTDGQVIGNASSGAQFVPSISEDPSVEVINFIRTPTWFNTRTHIPYSDTEKWIFANIPLAMRTAPSLDHVLVANSGFLASLYRPNLTLNFDGIAEIVENGIVTNTGEMLPCDVIVYATGFIGERYPMHVRGLNGLTIQGYYDAHGGPTAYLGTAIPDIPNFYLLAGPNTGTPTSTLFVEEVQVAYILQLIEPVLTGFASSFTVKASPTDAYNVKLQERISRSVLVQCYSWARTNGTGKLFNPFPWAVTVWWWWHRRPNWDHFVAVRYWSKFILSL